VCSRQTGSQCAVSDIPCHTIMHTHTHTHIYIYPSAHHAYTYPPMYIKYSNKYIYVCKDTCTHEYMCVCIHTSLHIYIHTCIYTYVHKYITRNIHTFTYLRNRIQRYAYCLLLQKLVNGILVGSFYDLVSIDL